MCLQTKKKELILQMMKADLEGPYNAYWGESFSGCPQQDKDNWLLDLRDMLAWEFDKDGNVMNDNEFVPNDEVRVFPLMTGQKARGCHHIAVNAWLEAYKTGKLRNWGHVAELTSVVHKLVYAVQVPTVNGFVRSRDFPSMYGLLDDTPDAERVHEVCPHACVYVLYSCVGVCVLHD